MTSRVQSLISLRHELDRFAVFTATAVFTLLAAASATGGLDLPGGTFLLALYPAGLLAADLLRPGNLLHRELRGAAAWSVLVLVAFELVTFLTNSLLIAVGFPFALGVAVLVAKRPAAATVLLVFFSAIFGTFQAFIGFSPSPLLDVILVGLWLVLAGRVVLGRPYNFVVWPAILGCALYIGLTIVDMLTSDDLGLAWFGFRTTAWYMLAFFALAYAGWARETYRRIALGIVGVTVLVAGYAVFRWQVGPAGAERTLAEFAGGGINVDPVDKHLKTVGSFQTGHQLAFWMAFMAPFCVAVAVWAKGWWRLLAVGATGLCILAMFASEARGPLPGFLAGAVVILGLYAASRAYPGFKAGIALLAIAAVAGGAGAVFVLGETDPERLDRYTRVLEPDTDPTFIQRELKWAQIIPAIDEEPFGHGLGSGGGGQQTVGSTVQLSEINIDNSYLMIAYEQGWLVMGLFIAVVLALLISIAVASVRTRSRQAAALGMGACGVLVSILVSFYTGLYIETAPIVAAWLIVGLGLSHFVAREAPERAPARAPSAPAWGSRREPQPAALMTR